MGGDGDFEIYFDGTTITLIETVSYSPTDWIDVIYVKRSSGVIHEVYINGSSEGTDNTSKALNTNLDYCQIGAWGDASEYWDGNVALLRFWTRPITIEEITRLQKES